MIRRAGVAVVAGLSALTSVVVAGCSSHESRAVAARTLRSASTASPDPTLAPLTAPAESIPWTLVRADAGSVVVVVGYSPGCRAPAYPQVAESRQSVTIRIVRPARTAWWCAEWGDTATIHLTAPLGTRRLVHAPAVDERYPAPPTGAP